MFIVQLDSLKGKTGQLSFKIYGILFSNNTFETASITQTLKSLQSYKKQEVFGICKIDLLESSRELYVQVFKEDVRLITYIRNTQGEEEELISTDIPIQEFEREINRFILGESETKQQIKYYVI